MRLIYRAQPSLQQVILERHSVEPRLVPGGIAAVGDEHGEHQDPWGGESSERSYRTAIIRGDTGAGDGFSTTPSSVTSILAAG
jgi:hypothetical protein